ncbi:MAG: methylthioadenosine phosphorylase [Candidatus Buchananbacteria bacterium RIFCSPHIGHO2_01_FULL_39_8]|uniref:Purine nucleoside phosphorylase n=1 Tax=Candidatus Buchananbacteria bacterium RIFCSPHIGHO2_01_FULL_39_8 TaxID=1797533 RepID=A0A1G1XXX8_9BACT|nr:MAG: methylthioadenosine phosphorylase [Candidatus Buchananbacteria bacterium RIFCSPHIGHO2_01_FULL_39_8]
MSDKKIKIGIIGGTGLDNPKMLKDYQEIEVDTPFGKPSSQLTTGKLGDKEVVIIVRHGKDHLIMPTKVNFRANIWALKEAGCSHILATTACGSLRQEIKPGDLVFIDQFIDNTKHRILTFYEDKVIHTPMAEPFCAKLRGLLVESAKDLGLSYHSKGTMVTIEGPRFSTKAESFMFQKWGADVINMSTVPEVILAREIGICYQSVAMSTDYDCWKDDEEPVTWEIIVERMKQNADNVKNLFLKTIPKIDFYDCECKNTTSEVEV